MEWQDKEVEMKAYYVGISFLKAIINGDNDHLFFFNPDKKWTVGVSLTQSTGWHFYFTWHLGCAMSVIKPLIWSVYLYVWRRKWQLTPVLLSGKSCGWRSLIDYSPWGHKELDTTEWLHSLTHSLTQLYVNSEYWNILEKVCTLLSHFLVNMLKNKSMSFSFLLGSNKVQNDELKADSLVTPFWMTSNYMYN